MWCQVFVVRAKVSWPHYALIGLNTTDWPVILPGEITSQPNEGSKQKKGGVAANPDLPCGSLELLAAADLKKGSVVGDEGCRAAAGRRLPPKMRTDTGVQGLICVTGKFAYK